MNDDKLSEKEIDEHIIAQADDEAVWIDVFKKRAERGSREKFLEILSKVPKVEPDPEDRIE